MNSDDKASPVNHDGQFLNSVPAWFAVGAALVYAAGFQVEFTFLNFMGVRNTGSELFKAKYIYVRLLCTLFPICITLIVISGWRMWRVGRAFKRSLKKVTVKDVKDLNGLLEKFKKPVDEVSKYLVQQFSDETSKTIESFTGQDEAEVDNMRFLLLKDINIVIRDKELYDKARFAPFELPWGTKAFRDQNPHGGQRRKFNRLLIGEAYSKEIETRLQPIGFKTYVPSLLLLFLLVLVTYLMIAFSRPGRGDFKGNEPWYFAFFMTAILGLIVPRRFEVALDRCRKERPLVHNVLKAINYDKWGGKAWHGLRWVVLGACCFIVMHVFETLWPLLGAMFRDGAFLYVGLVCLITSLLCATFFDGGEYSVAEASRSRKTLNVCVCLALTYVAIVNFAYRIYSYIPEEKGGGDYTTISSSIISFDDKYSNSLPHDIIDTNYQSKPVIILHKDANEIWAAIPIIAKLTVGNQSEMITNGPSQWREAGIANKPRLVFSIRREAVVAVTAIRSTNAANCLIYQRM